MESTEQNDDFDDYDRLPEHKESVFRIQKHSFQIKDSICDKQIRFQKITKTLKQNLGLLEPKQDFLFKNRLMIIELMDYIIWISISNCVVILECKSGIVVKEYNEFQLAQKDIYFLKKVRDNAFMVGGQQQVLVFRIFEDSVDLIQQVQFKKDIFTGCFHPNLDVFMVAGKDKSRFSLIGKNYTKRRKINFYNEKGKKILEIKLDGVQSASVLTHSEIILPPPQNEDKTFFFLGLLNQSQEKKTTTFYLFTIQDNFKKFSIIHFLNLSKFSIQNLFHLEFCSYLKKWLILQEKNDKNNLVYAIEASMGNPEMFCEEYPIEITKNITDFITSSVQQQKIIGLNKNQIILYDIFEECILAEINFQENYSFCLFETKTNTLTVQFSNSKKIEIYKIHQTINDQKEF